MTSFPTLVPAAPLVVVHCVDLSGSALERRLASVASTVPDDVEIVATTSRTHRRTAVLGGRVRLQHVTDGGHGMVDRAVLAGRLVITIPTTLELHGGWFEAAAERAERTSGIAVLVCGDEGLFVFPAGIGSVDAERVQWPSLQGVSIMASEVVRRRRRTLGAVLIVKDEEEVLPACLAALDGVVDQVVVYDTGSSDATVEVARATGAVVVEGYWDDDFGAARNRALASATTEWVLSIDADEVLECSASELRTWIDSAASTAAMVQQVSTSWSGADSGFEIFVVRLFRRELARWEGALHEVVTPKDAAGWSVNPSLAPLRLMHSGFRTTSTEGKDKGARNTGIARAAQQRAEFGTLDWVTATAHYGRSLALADRFDEALAELAQLLDHEVPAAVMLPAARVACHLLIVDADRAAEAERWIDRAEAVGEARGQVALWRARLALTEGDWWGASDLLAEFDTMDADGGVDLWGRPFDMALTVTALAEVDLLLGLPVEALQKMQAVLHRAPDRVKISTLFRTTTAAGFSLRDLAREAPESFRRRSLRDATEEVPDIALAWFTALADEYPGDHRPVVAASVLAARTGVTEALEWAIRAREAGLTGVCALRLLGEDAQAPAPARLLAWAVLLHGFGELDAASGVLDLVDRVNSSERAAALDSLRLVAPDVVDLTASAAVVGGA